MKLLNLIFIGLLFSLPALAKLPSAEALLKENAELTWDMAISRSIIIHAPIEEVWKYVSDSSRAVNWSVYFDHISPLPGVHADGTVGSLRRCFRNKDESGEYWDELTLETIPLKMRQIVSYNFTNYPLRSFYEDEYVYVRQLYRPIDANRTELTFQTLKRPNSGLVWRFLFGISKNETDKIFGLNLINIKQAIEGKPRKHPWR